MRSWLVLLSIAVLVSGCGGEAASGDPFAYDGEQPLTLEEGSELPANDRVVVEEVSYSSGGDRVEAYLVSPRPRQERLPAVVFLHGAGGDREEQLGFAAQLVEVGAADSVRLDWLSDHLDIGRG